MAFTVSPITNVAPSSITSGVASVKNHNASGKSFADFLQDTVEEKIEVLNNFEKASAASTKGQISELELIKAVNEADIQLHAFKTVWEKFLQKYETIIEKTNI